MSQAGGVGRVQDVDEGKGRVWVGGEGETERWDRGVLAKKRRGACWRGRGEESEMREK